MGLLDGLMKSALGGGNSQQDMLMSVVGSLLNGQGGLSGLVNNFNKAGLGDIVNSWVSTGHNLPISATQLTQALGSGQLEQLARQLGMNSGQAGDLLSKYLPQVVDRLTPNGQITDHQGGDLLNTALGALKGSLFK